MIPVNVTEPYLFIFGINEVKHWMQVRINRNSGMEFSFWLTDQNFGMEFSFGMTDRNSGMEFSFPLIRILDMYPQGNQTGCTFCGLKTQFYNGGI